MRCQAMITVAVHLALREDHSVTDDAEEDEGGYCNLVGPAL